MKKSIKARIKVVTINPVTLVAFFRTGNIHKLEVIEGLPRDAKLVGAYELGGDFKLIVESETFEELNYGDEVPELPCITMKDL